MSATSRSSHRYAKPRTPATRRSNRLEGLIAPAVARLPRGPAPDVHDALGVEFVRLNRDPASIRFGEGIERHASQVLLLHELIERVRVVALVGVELVQSDAQDLQVFLEGDFPGLVERAE